MDTTAERLLREPAVLAQTSDSRDTHWKSIKSGKMTPPVKSPGTDRNVWPQSEVQAIVRARIAGANDDALRKLVAALMAKRTAGAHREAA